MSKRFFLFDCETGGLDPSYSLLTLSGAVLNEDYEVIEAIDLAVKPKSERYVVHPAAMKVNKIDLVEYNAMAFTEEEAAEKLKELLVMYSGNGDSRMVPAGHNVAMDIAFAKNLLPSFGKYVLHRAHDTAGIASFCQDLGLIPANCELSLSELCTLFGIDHSGIHNAKIDVELTRQVMISLRKLACSREIQHS